MYRAEIRIQDASVTQKKLFVNMLHFLYPHDLQVLLSTTVKKIPKTLTPSFSKSTKGWAEGERQLGHVFVLVLKYNEGCVGLVKIVCSHKHKQA